ncbi:MAG: class I SAM-dependent methyltransferase [Methylomonas sp.]|nr:class I SAM-dependent methyltransferase [Methylomonas sp.]
MFFKKNDTYLTETIKEMDELPCCHPASVNLDVANIYYSLTKMLRPLLIVEIGCFIGFSTQHFAQAIKELGFGRIISIDAFDWDVDAGRGMQNRFDVAEYYKNKANVGAIVEFIKGYSTEVYPAIADQIKQKIDLLYIDGDHSINGVFADFNTYYNDVRVGGFVILHDIYPEMCGVDGPRALVDCLKAKHVPHNIELIEMQTKDGFGIALLRKINDKPLQVTPIVKLVEKSWWRLINALPLRMSRTSFERQIIIQVVDALTQQPIIGVKMICPQRFNEERISDSNGLINLSHYLPNRYLMDFYAEGYQDARNQLFDISSEKFSGIVRLKSLS